MPEVGEEVRQAEFDRALQEFQDAYIAFFEDKKGYTKTLSVDELEERSDRWDEARLSLHELIEWQCEIGGGIEVALSEDERVDISEPGWFENASHLNGSRHTGVDLMKAERIEPISGSD